MSGSRLPSDLITAYRQTHYRVFSPRPFILRIDTASEQLAAVHRARGVECSAFLTAWNPHSRIASRSLNATSQEDLRSELARRDLTILEGIGEHPSNGWEGEPSLLVLGLRRAEAEKLGRRFEQNSIVWADSDCVPRLILLR